MSKVLSPRELVMNRLVRRVRAFPDLEIAPMVTDGLQGRDQALAWAIDQAVSRRWLTLASLLGVHLSRPWDRIEPGAQAALLAGAAQLVLMDRLPDYAVIDASVEWTKRRVRPKAGGLVNAVLRRLAEMVEASAVEAGRGAAEWTQREMPMEDGRVRVFDRDVFAEDAIERLAQQTSHTAELLERWRELFGEAKMRALALHSVVMPPTVVTGVSPEAEDLRCTDGARMLAPHEKPGFFVFTGGHADLTLLLSSGPACRVQDWASAQAVTLAHGLSPKLVIDLCAGRGTKTRQLAAQFPEAEIVASDASAERVKVLAQVFDGDERVRVKAPGELDEFAGRAELVLCDVPCSNTGVLARRSEAKYRFSAAHVRELVKLQASIVNRAAGLLTSGGSLLYATCSVESAENIEQVEAAAGRHGLELVRADQFMPNGLPGASAGAYHDGGYAALLAKAGG